MKYSVLTAAGAAAVLVGSLAGVPAVSAQPTRAAHASATVAAPLVFGPCADPALTARGLTCGSLKVPLDYAKPDGPQITLQVTRRLHTTLVSKGVVLTNPGGPGGDGSTLPVLQQYVPNGAGMAYDWIGWAPRGVAPSSPALRCAPKYFGYNRPNYVPSIPSRMSFWKHKTAAFSAACGRAAAKALLPHLTTRDNARDMDSIRAALGEEQINYYGFSWGTYLGQVYARLFPSRVGRFIWDGVVDPTRVWYSANLDQDRAFDSNMNIFWMWLAKYPSKFHLGSDWRKIRAGYYAELKKLDRRPAAGGKLGPDELGDAMLGAGYYIYGWDDLGHAYSDLIRKGNGAALLAEYAGGDPADNNGYSIYSGVQCTDNPWPAASQTIRDSWRTHRVAPFLTWGNTWYNFPCQTWPVKAQRRTTINGTGISNKILLISETRDAATPYAGALKVRSLFPTASLIAGVGGTTHASSLSGVACVDDAVAAFLSDGTVPKRVSGSRADKLCPKLAPPTPTTVGARTMPPATTGVPADVRRVITQQQHLRFH